MVVEDGALSFKHLFTRALSANPDRLHFAAHSFPGAILPDPGAGPGVASSIAEQLIAIGVRMVVA